MEYRAIATRIEAHTTSRIVRAGLLAAGLDIPVGQYNITGSAVTTRRPGPIIGEPFPVFAHSLDAENMVLYPLALSTIGAGLSGTDEERLDAGLTRMLDELGLPDTGTDAERNERANRAVIMLRVDATIAAGLASGKPTEFWVTDHTYAPDDTAAAFSESLASELIRYAMTRQREAGMAVRVMDWIDDTSEEALAVDRVALFAAGVRAVSAIARGRDRTRLR
jgi:hypothetical protein